MAFNENKYSQEHLLGNASLPYAANPKLRGRIRRNDPDSSTGHTAPWFSGLAGTRLKLEVNFSNPITPPPLTTVINVDFTTDYYADALSALRLADTANLVPEDDNGFLALISKHTGDQNYIKILPCGGGYTEAAGIFGLDLDPLPGSICYAGELSPAAAFKDEPNPQGSMLVALDEDITSTVINRAIVGAALRAKKELRDLNRELFVVKEYAAEVHTPSVTGEQYATIATSNDRLALQAFQDAYDAGKIAELLDNNGRRLFQTGGTLGGTGSQVKISDICYGGPPFTPGTAFGAWLTPDGGSILVTEVLTKDKHAAVAISAIRGNILYCPGATFLTNQVSQGDTLIIEEATNDNPFSHNGEFAVDRVWSEEYVAVRPKVPTDLLTVTAVPTRLNLSKPAGKVYGTARVIVGTAFPMTAAGPGTSPDLRFLIAADVAVPDGAGYKLRVLTSLTQDDYGATRAMQALPLQGNLDDLATKLRRHVDELEDTGPFLSVYLHNASKIKGTILPVWQSGDQVAAGRVQTQIETVVANLAASSSPDPSGADRVGSKEYSGTPHSLTAGSVRHQFGELLLWFNQHVNVGTADRHRALDVDFGGTSNQWADGGAVGAQTVDAVIANFVLWLASQGSADGAGKIGAKAVAGTLASLTIGSVRSQLNQLRSWIDSMMAFDNAVTTRINAHVGGTAERHTASQIDYAGGGAWADGTTNPAATVEAQLDKIISDLAPYGSENDGAAKIGAYPRSVLTGHTIHSQLININDWFANYLGTQHHYTASQHFDQDAYGRAFISTRYFWANYWPAEDDVLASPYWLTGRNTPKALFQFESIYPSGYQNLTTWAGYNCDRVWADCSLNRLVFQFKNSLHDVDYGVYFGCVYSSQEVAMIPYLLPASKTVDEFKLLILDPRTLYAKFALGGLSINAGYVLVI